MSKSVIAAFAAAAALLGTGAAHAGNVYWSIGISAPPIGTVISNAPAPVYDPAPVYVPAPVYGPAPVVYQSVPVYAPPPVVYRHAPRVVYAPPVVVSRPVPVVYGGWRHPHGAWGDRDRDGIPNWKDGRDNRREWDDRRHHHGDRR